MVEGEKREFPVSSLEERLARYVEKAQAAGVEVEFTVPEDLAGRLAALLSHGNFQRESDVPFSERSGRLAMYLSGVSISQSATRMAALPVSGWPHGLREQVESSLLTSGFEIVAPVQTDKGYIWERSEIAAASLGITFCAVFLAQTGSLVLPSGPGFGTQAALLPEVHLALSYPQGCIESLADTLGGPAGTLPSRVTLVTGPSRTGDIEATMTTGVHGPRRVIHLILTGGILSAVRLRQGP